MTARYLIGDTRDLLDAIPDGSVDLIVTSPPFLALRSYLPADHPDKHREIGSEATPADFLSTLLALTVEWRRVLAPHGSLCVELGDTYSGSGGAGGDYNAAGLRDGQEKFNGSARRGARDDWPLPKSMCGIPTLYTWSLAYGRNLLRPEHTLDPWRIRNLLVWARPNPPVGALGDKFRPATSYITVACTSPRRWFDLDAVRDTSKPPNPTPSAGGNQIADPSRNTNTQGTGDNPAGAPPLDWHTDCDPGTHDGDMLWALPTAPYPGSHFATYPPELPARLIKAMCPMQVCRVCGEPRRRVVEAPTEFRDRHPEFAAMLRAHRTARGMTQRDVDALFGLNGVCSHWERRITGPQSQPSYPTPDQWRALRDALDIRTDEYESLITGFRRMAERDYSPEYRAQIERTRAEGFYTSTGTDGMARSGVNGRSTSAGHRTLGWSDCGHGDYRPGLVLDPFAGSGTTLAAATGAGRDAIGFDLDPRNADLARERVGMFLDIEKAVGA